LVLSSLYQIPTSSSQRCEWVVGCGWYHIVGDNLSHNFQDTILTPGITGYVVKIMKDEHKVLDIILQCLDDIAYFVFIELSYSSSSDDLTHGGSSMKLPILNFQCLASQLLQPSNLESNI
jgi:hypothetical protein